jgi:TfoX/Sxy family transcriptional regulator of competence genes
MAWTKSPEALVNLFIESLPDDPRIERRKMFGYPSAFVNGNMFTGLFQDQMFVRVSPEDHAALEGRYGPLPFEPMAGRPMRGYTRLPDDIIADEGEVAAWIAKSLAWSAALPAKEKKPAKKKGR